MSRRAGVIVLTAALLASAGRPASGQDAFAACEQELEARPDSEQSAKCFYDSADNNEHRLEAARRLAEHVEDRPEAAWLSFYLGSTRFRSRSCRDEGPAAYRRAARLFAAAGDTDSESRARTNLVWFLLRCGDLVQASRELPEAEKAAAGSTDPMAMPGFDLARFSFPIRSGRDLATAYERLERHWRTLSQQELAPYGLRRETLRALEFISQHLGRSKKARYWFKQHLDLAERLGKRRALAEVRVQLLLEEMANDLPSDRSRREFVERLRGFFPLSDETPADSEAKIRLHLAKMEGGQEAEAHLRRCRELAREQADDTLERTCTLALAGQRLDDEPESARRLLAEVYGDGLFESSSPRALVEGWRDHLRVLWQTHSFGEAWAVSDRILSDMERLRGLQTGLAQAELLQSWSDAYYWLAGRLLEDRAMGDGRLRRAFAVIERLRAQQLREALLLNGNDVGSPQPLPEDLLEEVESTLGADEAMLSYHLALWEDVYGRFAGGAWVLVSTPEGSRAHRLEVDRVQIEPTVMMLIDKKDGQWGAGMLAHFYDELLRPALDELPASVERLTIVPDGILHLLPFAALRSSEEELFLGEKYEISIQPSASLWLRWKKSERAWAGPDALVLADPAFEVDATLPAGVGEGRHRLRGEVFERLRHARSEGRKVARHLGGASQLKLGLAASESFLKRVNLEPFALLHFATHAVAGFEETWRSGVLLASGGDVEDGWLQPSEIADLELRGKTVILSTCNSATGRWLRGEGVLSLARAFFAAGAHAVVGTLRRLPDDDAEQFFDVFYRHVSRGLSLRQSLAATQREWAAEGRPASTWASVVVLGNGDVVPAPAGIERARFASAWLAAAGGLLLGLLLWRLAGAKRQSP